MGHNVDKQVKRFNETFAVGQQLQWRSIANESATYQTLTVKDIAFDLHKNAVFIAVERSGVVSAESRFVKFPKKKKRCH